MNRYKVLKQGIKYYVVPDIGINYIQYPKNFLGFFFKRDADKVVRELESAWKDGYMYRAMFPPVPLKAYTHD